MIRVCHKWKSWGHVEDAGQQQTGRASLHLSQVLGILCCFPSKSFQCASMPPVSPWWIDMMEPYPVSSADVDCLNPLLACQHLIFMICCFNFAMSTKSDSKASHRRLCVLLGKQNPDKMRQMLS